MIALTCSRGAAWSLKSSCEEVIQWWDSLAFRRRCATALGRQSNTHARTCTQTHACRHTRKRDTEKKFAPGDKHADVWMRKVSARLYFLIHSLIFFFLLFFIIFISTPSLSVTPPLCCTFFLLLCFNYSSLLPRWHFNQNKSVRLFPITDRHDSRDPNPQREEGKSLKASLLCLRGSYLFIYLKTLPSKHISQKAWCVDFRWSGEIELQFPSTTTGIFNEGVRGNNGAAITW